MSIAFEISPLLNASGTFGDKSGVYRYTYGLISSMADMLYEKNRKDKILLFALNVKLLNIPINPEIIRLVKRPNIIFLNECHKLFYVKTLNRSYSKSIP